MDVPSLCPTPGRPEMYGLGIRVGFYIQWLAAVIIEYFDEDDLPDVRFLGALFSAAATTSLVVQLARDRLQPMDIYITLLLAIGIFFFFMPLHVWRILTRCNPNLDPFQLSKEQHGLIYQVCTFVLLATNAGVATWFYTSYLPDLDRACHQYAFVFGKTDLEDKRYIVFSAMFYICVLIACAAFLLFHPCCRYIVEVDDRHYSRVRYLDGIHGMWSDSHYIGDLTFVYCMRLAPWLALPCLVSWLLPLSFLLIGTTSTTSMILPPRPSLFLSF